MSAALCRLRLSSHQPPLPLFVTPVIGFCTLNFGVFILPGAAAELRFLSVYLETAEGGLSEQRAMVEGFTEDMGRGVCVNAHGHPGYTQAPVRASFRFLHLRRFWVGYSKSGLAQLGPLSPCNHSTRCWGVGEQRRVSMFVYPSAGGEGSDSAPCV